MAAVPRDKATPPMRGAPGSLTAAWVLGVSIAGVAIACSSPPSAETANMACSAYLSAHGGAGAAAVTRHVAALLLSGELTATEPGSVETAVPVATLLPRLQPAQVSDARAFALRTCRLRLRNSVLSAVTYYAGEEASQSLTC
jgi:hypothetical protein